MVERPIRRDLIVIGASAGGVEALRTLVAELPDDFGAAVCIVLHVMPTGTSLLPEILGRSGPLEARHAADGASLEPGCIYVAPPNHHLLVEDGRMRVTLGPRENGHRPAVDALFRTAARSHGDRVVGVILSGALDDGTAGLRAIRLCGGATLVQAPEEALYPSMPLNAIDHVRPDYVLPVKELAQAAAQLVTGELDPTREREEHAMGTEYRKNPPVYTCPDCGGALEEVPDDEILRFRCKVGHVYSQESLLHEQSEHLESALWAALRALEDRAELTRRVVSRMRGRGSDQRFIQRYERQATDAEEHARTLRDVLLSVEAIEQPDPAAGIAE